MTEWATLFGGQGDALLQAGAHFHRGQRGDRHRGGDRSGGVAVALGQLVGARAHLHGGQGRDAAGLFPGLLGQLVGGRADLHGGQGLDGFGGLHRRNNRGAGNQGDGDGNGLGVHDGACLVLVISGVVSSVILRLKPFLAQEVPSNPRANF
ncbi:hypothetical protein G6F24_016018 [Rhizopus arrhizus]|nr:hypothetical protein G6F24_016018 [Rhizopus arrhizus]